MDASNGNHNVTDVIKSKEAVIYIVRHGETSGNYERVFKDPMTAYLTERGRNQAKAAGQRLSDIKFSKVYSSHYPRATETAQIILKESKQSSSLKLSIDERIRERGHGEFEGKKYDEANALRGVGLRQSDPLFPYAKFYVKGTEGILTILERAESFFRDLAKELDESESEESENILIICHGYFVELWMTHIGLSNPKFKVMNHSKKLSVCLQNCGFHKFKFWTEKEKGGDLILCWEFLEIHQDQHLSAVGFKPVVKK